MKVKSVIRTKLKGLKDDNYPKGIEVTYGKGGTPVYLYWGYNATDNTLNSKVKKHGGIWDRDLRKWRIDDPEMAVKFLNYVSKSQPDLQVINNNNKTTTPLEKFDIYLFSFGGLDACMLPYPLPYHTDTTGNFSDNTQAFLVEFGSKKKSDAGLLIGAKEYIYEFISSMTTQGAVIKKGGSKEIPFNNFHTKIQVKVNGWAVEVKFDLNNPYHIIFAPENKYIWENMSSFGIKLIPQWDGTIHTTRKLWVAIKNKIHEYGLSWDGDDPEADLIVPIDFDSSLVSGWDCPAPNGHLLHDYQKIGVEFCASRGMRALIGDEMGVGKTLQAISAAEATRMERVFIICPGNARYVWDSELKGWGAQGEVQHVLSQIDMLNPYARWHIITYDLITSRAENWIIKNKMEEKEFIDVYPSLRSSIKDNPKNEFPKKVSIDQPLSTVPAFTDPERVSAWEKMMRRLRGELMEQILSLCSNKTLVIIDEAHRAKNNNAKRTMAIKRLGAGETRLLLLTGTPLRNNEHEAAVLLGIIDPEASDALSKKRGYTIEDVREYLNYFMIRRLKADILPELPDKTRQRIDISSLDPECIVRYQSALDYAYEKYFDALKKGFSETIARQSMRGGISMARTELGMAKVLGGDVAELVGEVLANKGCCVVFCAHHIVSDELRNQLEPKFKVGIVDGRTSQFRRAQIVENFQNGNLDVFIGGINAAGEAITLTRSDTIILVELDWVPAALLQVEDRIHRIGQLSNCHIIQVIAKMDGINLDEMMIKLLGEKIERIGMVLRENTTYLVENGIQSELEGLIVGKKIFGHLEKPLESLIQ